MDKSISDLCKVRESWYNMGEKEMHRLLQGGITHQVINGAMASFILETIVQHGEPADILCNKDPLALIRGEYLSEIFPKSKWIFMVRDGRAVIHSIISRFDFYCIWFISSFIFSEKLQCLSTFLMTREGA